MLQSNGECREETRRLAEELRSVRLIATDMDGTFLNDKHEATTSNALAFQQAKQEGYIVAAATGRSRRSTLESLKAQAVAMDYAEGYPGVYLNGLSVYGPDGEVVYEKTLEPEITCRVLDYLQEAELLDHVTMYTRSDIYCFRMNPYTAHTCRTFGDTCPLILTAEESNGGLENMTTTTTTTTADTPASDIESCVETKQDQKQQIQHKSGQADTDLKMRIGRLSISKILVTNKPPATLHLRETLHSLFAHCVNIIHTDPWFLEILPLGESKGKGLQRLLAHLGLREEQTLAIGDGDNDIDMLQISGVSVAMQNGSLDAKNAAKFVGGHNDSDGFAKLIDLLLTVRKSTGG